MKLKFDSKNLFLIIATGLIVGACGPVAPSISKLTGGGSSSSDSAVKDLSASSSEASDPTASQDTVIKTESDFKNLWSAVSTKHPSIEFDAADLVEVKDKFKPSKNARAEQVAEVHSTASRVTGSEATLAGPKAKVRHYLIVDDNTDVKGLHLDDVKLGLIWVPKSTVADRHWEVKIKSPNIRSSDPVEASTAELIYKALLKHLVGVAVEFEAD